MFLALLCIVCIFITLIHSISASAPEQLRKKQLIHSISAIAPENVKEKRRQLSKKFTSNKAQTVNSSEFRQNWSTQQRYVMLKTETKENPQMSNPKFHQWISSRQKMKEKRTENDK